MLLTFKKRVLWFLLSVTLVVAAAAVVLLWDQSSFDGLRRSVIYARAQKGSPPASYTHTAAL